ncbi:LysR substrate-binding domain-containing protein [Chelatococcus sp. GCM10030263]|uniref:LysR substrate-binding domain-containing protein n=1 Tax=Chelatococcus sp. GCM10030263 TaxID=3273387 RepID=UPI00360EA55E
MKHHHLRNVLTVAEVGSLRAASRLLGIAQPAITRSIREIESELGAQLFERHAKGVRLTPVGQVFVRRGQTAMAELRRAKEEIGQMLGGGGGEVSIAMSTAASLALFPAAVVAFRKRHPDTLVKVKESMFQPVEAEVLDGQIDFYVGPFDTKLGPARLSVEKLFDNRRVVIARKGHLHAKATTLAELAGEKWIRPALSVQHSEADFHRHFELLGLPPPRIIMQASALHSLLTVANTDVLMIAAEQLVESSKLAEFFDVLPLEVELDAAPICIVRCAHLPLTPVAEYLCDMMRRAGEHYAARRRRG